MSSTKLTGQEMGQIIDTLPKKDREKMKSTYENIIDMGFDMGKKRGEEFTKLKLTFDAIKMGMETVFITQIFGISENLIKLIKRNLNKNFEHKDLSTILVSELLMDFQYLGNDDIADFCNVSVERVEHLRKVLLVDEA